jgi:hypothetical protein
VVFETIERLVKDMRLIDADALSAEHCEGCSKDIQDGCKTDPVCATLMWFKDAPSIDAVPMSQLREMLSDLERMCRGGDEGETYTTGYRNGHHNGQIELLRYILQVPDGTSEDGANEFMEAPARMFGVGGDGWKEADGNGC